MAQNTQISEEKEFKSDFLEYLDEPDKSLGIYKSEVWCYRGLISQPKWKDVDRGKYLSSVIYLEARE